MTVRGQQQHRLTSEQEENDYQFVNEITELFIVRNGELRVVIYALLKYYSNCITKYLVISLEPKETKFKIRLALWTLVELFHKVTINSIADMFTTRIYNQEKKASKELKLKKDVTLHFS